MVCNDRSLFGSSDTSGHGPGNFRKISITSRGSASPGAWHLGAGTRFASIPIRGSQRCLAPGAGTRFASIPIRDRKGAWHDRKGAWHRVRGLDLPAFRFRDRKGAWHRVRGLDLPAFRLGIAKVPGTWVRTKFASIPIRDRKGDWHRVGRSPWGGGLKRDQLFNP